jgi:prophage maintenance system killer protein
MIAFLEENGLHLSATDTALYNFVVSISTGEIKFEEIVEWLQANTK